MRTFKWLRPTSLDEAQTAFLENEDSRYLAGGMSLIPTMKLGLSTPELLVDLSSIAGLKGITRDDDRIRIGALTRHCDVSCSPIIKDTTPGLSILAGGIGDRQVRNRGTIGGSVANCDPAACYPAAVLGLEAVIKTNTRQIPAEKLFLGLFETSLEPGEIITGVEYEIPRSSHYVKFHQKASRFALVGVFASQGSRSEWRIAVTGAATHAFRIAEFESVLNGGGSPNDFTDNFSSPSLNSDIHGSADYRRHLVRVIAARAVAHLSTKPAAKH